MPNLEKYIGKEVKEHSIHNSKPNQFIKCLIMHMIKLSKHRYIHHTHKRVWGPVNSEEAWWTISVSVSWLCYCRTVLRGLNVVRNRL